MNIEEELKELAQSTFKESRNFLLDQKPLNDAVAAYVRAKVGEALDRIEKASAHTQPSLHDEIEAIRKELN